MDKPERKAAPKLGAKKKKTGKKVAKKAKKVSSRKPRLKFDANKESSPMMKVNAVLAVLTFCVLAYLAYTDRLGDFLDPILK